MTGRPPAARVLGHPGGAPVALSRPSAPPPPVWRATERALRLLTVTAVAAAAALLTGNGRLLALAAGPLVLLVLAAAGRSRPTRLTASAEVDQRRCFEDETVTVRVRLTFDGTASWIDPALHPGPGLALADLTVTGPLVELRLTATRWGRWTLGPLDLDLYDRAGLARRTLRVELGQIEVFPSPARSTLTPIPVRLPEHLGEHTSRQRGEGLEVQGVRPHVWGERQRRIHWPSTTRRGSVQITQFAAERAADTVVLIDALSDYADPATGRSSLDETVRTASGIVRAYLRSHDRVGVVSIGGTTRWLTPATGAGYFYRLIETVLDVRSDLGYEVPDLARLPRPVIPAGALVYAVTSLTDQRMLDVLRDLSRRGCAVVVVEIPIGDPVPEEGSAARRAAGELALEFWKFDREAMRYALRVKGLPVLAAQPGESLDLALAPLLRSRIQGRI
ncbi:hypothetical protein CFP65_7495 [Kitasatospora sp. MMS16-BH015]|uniref:DUF58 domain-containing protein n=1 Tax=Kitasatospora sp. MMS16-BH015 TaxID=2018025 RepID=UPI000CA368E2|nr:DUF58 domain-containing protein [Kitasatospora sp. MMS16-BH015]AUG82073.1 hypothetical protein CFP65_7495 [Kitasatospora sp. MMS16-BH015]